MNTSPNTERLVAMHSSTDGDISQAELPYDVPQFEGLSVSDNEVARLVGYISAAEEPEPFCRVDVKESLGMNQSAVSQITKALVDNEFLEDLGPYSDPGRAGRPIKLLRRTPRLEEYADYVPLWSNKTDFYRIKKKLEEKEQTELTEEQIDTYLVRLGKQALGIDTSE